VEDRAILSVVCARFTLRKWKLKDVADTLDAEYGPDDEALYRPRYNVAPTDLAWIVEYGADRRVLRPATWNYLVSGGHPLINLRGENVGSGAGYRDAFASRRCAIVTDAFYEWPGKGLAPFLLHRADDGLVLLGGLFQRPKGADVHARFTVLTTPPNQLVARVHDRMPVILPVERLDEWLTAKPAEAARLIGPAPENALVATPISKHVNSVRNDDPECVAPTEHGAAPAQTSLF
jgi:putative SOS response-associated peptidase YedK